MYLNVIKMLRQFLLILMVQKLLSIFYQPAAAGIIAAWTSEYLNAPQVIMHNDTTTTIVYSLCNSNGKPSFMDDATFDLPWPPLNGTSVSGFTSQIGDVYESMILTTIQYQNNDGAIVWCTFSCNASSGYYKSYASDIIEEAPTPHAYPKTDLVIVPQASGYWLFYKDILRASSVFRYENQSRQWQYLGNASQDDASAISVAATLSADGKVFTFASPRRDGYGVIETATFDSSSNKAYWEIGSFPRTFAAPRNTAGSTNSNATLTNYSLTNDFQYDEELPKWSLSAFNGSKSQIRLATGHDNSTNLFYIGTDKYLHQISCIDDIWQPGVSQSKEKWPMADEEDAHLALTYNGTNLWIYYMSNASIIQVHQSGPDTWEPAMKLIDLQETNAPNDETSNSNDPAMSDTTKLELGISLGVGIAVVGSLIEIGIYFFIRKKHSKRHGNNVTDTAETSTSQYVKDLRDGHGISLSGQVAHEMAPDPRAHEVLVEERINELTDDTIIAELPTITDSVIDGKDDGIEGS